MNLVPTIYGLIAGLVTGPMILAAVTQAGAASELQGTKDVLRDGPSLAEFVDRIVTNRMREFRVPGAVVTVVRGDRVLVNKGYGFADLEDRRPVDPEKTLFRIASVSKVFNAMAVMRLVDEGLIGIDEDVRPRLRAAGLELDTTAEGPITLKALLTHTAGIRDLSTPDLAMTKDPGKLLPLGPYLKQCLPLRWQDPGETVLYTDIGITLAGYVVEVVSKTEFQEYVLTKVIRPLGMRHTSYTLSEEQRAHLATAYSHEASGYKATPFLYSNNYPASGVITTGSDMARLMIAHLSGCKGFLTAKTVKLMHEPQHSDDPRLGVQWTCGFVYETHSKGNTPYLFHFGGAFDMQSILGISLDRGIGVFVSQNRPGGRVFQLVDLLDALSQDEAGTDSAAKPPVTAVTGPANIKSLAGTYVLNRNLSRGVKIPPQDYVFVRYVEDIKGIEVEYWQNKDSPMRLIQVAPLLFQSVNGEQRLSFRTSKDGQTTYLIDYNMRGDGAFKRISPLDRPSVPERHQR